MKTKLGEVKEWMDLFAVGEKGRLINPGYQQGTERYECIAECKMCGEKIKTISNDSAMRLFENGLSEHNEPMYKHFQLHKDIALLKLNK